METRETGGRRWRLQNGVLYLTSGGWCRREVRLCKERLLYVELCQRPWHRLFHRARVKLYVAVRRRPVFIAQMEENQAAALVNRIAAGETPSGAGKRRYLAPGRHAAFWGALTSRSVLLPWWLGAWCLGMGGRWFLPQIMSAVLLAAGLLALGARLLSEGWLSVCILPEGFAIRMGVGGSRRLFVPRHAVVGVVETASPAALFCGGSRMELLCEGGVRLPCMRWYTGGTGREAALRLLDCEGLPRTWATDGKAFCTRYLRLTALLFLGLPVWLWSFYALYAVGMFQAIWLPLLVGAALSAGILAILHCLTAVRFGGEAGVSISAGTLRMEGMGMLSAERLTLRRGCLAAVRVRQGLTDRAANRCTAELIPKGCRRGGQCTSLPYEKLLAIVERFA